MSKYPAHLVTAARGHSVDTPQNEERGSSPPCPVHGDDKPPVFLTYPLMASVPEEELSESGRTYTLSNPSENQDENEPSFVKRKLSSREASKSSPLSEIQHRKSEESSYHTAKSQKKSSDSYFSGRESSPASDYLTKFSSDRNNKREASPQLEGNKSGRHTSGEFYFPPTRKSSDNTTVYDRDLQSYIPRDPGCPVHSHCHKPRSAPFRSVPTSPVKLGPLNQPNRVAKSTPTTPISERPKRPTSLKRSLSVGVTTKSCFSRASPARTRHSFRSSSGGRSSTSPPQQLPSPSRMLVVNAIQRMEEEIKETSNCKETSIVAANSSRSSAAESELLHCTICTKQFDNPKVLPCLHTFCLECLHQTTPAESLTISCMECKQQSILPQNGVTDLQSNTWVQNVIDSLDYTVNETRGKEEMAEEHEEKRDEGSESVTKNKENDATKDDTLRCASGRCSEDTNDALVLCVKCQLHLCVKCQEIHKIESEHEAYEPVKKQEDNHSTTCNGTPGGKEEHVLHSTKEENSVSTRKISEEDIFGDDTKMSCPNHEGMSLRFYCRDCDTAVCISCTDIQHRMHSTLRLSEAMGDQTTAMQAMVEAVANKVPALTCCIEDLEECIEELKVKKETAEEGIKRTFEVLRHALDKREATLLSTLNNKAQDKTKMLETQKKELETWRSNLSAGGELLERSVQESKAPMELVLLKKQFGDKLKEFVNADTPAGPRENTLLSFEKAHADSFLKQLNKVGFVVTNPAVPFTTIASGDALTKLVVGRRGHITVITRDFRGERVGSGGANLSITLTPKYTSPSPPTTPCSYDSRGSYPNGSLTKNESINSPASEKSPSPQPSPHSNGGDTPPSVLPFSPPNQRASFRRQSTSEESSATGAANHLGPRDLYTSKIVDHNTGIYDIELIVHRAGVFTMEISLYGAPIDQSPFTLTTINKKSSPAVRRSTFGGSVAPHRSAEGSVCSIHGSEKSFEGPMPFGPFRQQSKHSVLSAKHSVLSAKHSSVSCRTGVTASSRRTPSQRSSSSRLTQPIEDDLLMRVGLRGRNKGEFVNPQGICFSDLRGGRIVVTDSISQCVQVFSSEGEFKIRFGTRGRSVGQLQRPTGVGTLLNGNYAVADYENKCVSIFEPNGKFVNRIGHGKLLGPKGVCSDNKGNIIVVDNKGSCICIFTPQGKLLTKFGNKSITYLSFAGPHFVAVNSLDHIIATDFHNHCVKVFDSSGEFLFTFGNHGEGNGQFNAPTGIAVDENDNIIVADWGNSRIQVFDSRGSFLSFVNTLADPLHGPQGLSYTSDGHIVVADSGNHCYKVYKYLQ